jgi:acyl-CoA thioester hydrolase
MKHSHRQRHVSQIPVRWGDMDALGHVNNTVYFRYMEQARVEWLESLGVGVVAGQAESVVIINASCTFLVPITYPGTVEVRLSVGELGRSSIPTYYEMYCVGEEALYAEGESKVIWINGLTGKSAPLPDLVRARLAIK